VYSDFRKSEHLVFMKFKCHCYFALRRKQQSIVTNVPWLGWRCDTLCTSGFMDEVIRTTQHKNGVDLCSHGLTTRESTDLIPRHVLKLTHQEAATCDRPLRRCVNLSRRQHLRNALFDALHQLSGTHYQNLFSVVTLLPPNPLAGTLHAGSP